MRHLIAPTLLVDSRILDPVFYPTLRCATTECQVSSISVSSLRESSRVLLNTHADTTFLRQCTRRLESGCYAQRWRYCCVRVSKMLRMHWLYYFGSGIWWKSYNCILPSCTRVAYRRYTSMQQTARRKDGYPLWQRNSDKPRL